MNPDNIPGTEAEVSEVVTEDMCPALDGVVVHWILSRRTRNV